MPSGFVFAAKFILALIINKLLSNSGSPLLELLVGEVFVLTSVLELTRHVRRVLSFLQIRSLLRSLERNKLILVDRMRCLALRAENFKFFS